MKTQIIEKLGQGGILLPTLVAEGLAANDRIKVHMAKLMKEIQDDAAIMIRAVDAGTPDEGTKANARLETIRSAGLLEAASDIEIARIARLTGVTDAGGDSLHRLVMDLHKQLNKLAASCSEEALDGAHVFGLHGEDRAAVAAFMKGLNATRGLKFNHPGLDTMATRAGGRLLIQNDIGTTDAHVVVIAVKKNAVTVTYTDVHLARAKFFMSLFDRFDATWSGLDRHTAAGLGEDNSFYLVTGRYQADYAAERNEFLSAIGAALVFLIDWNKARKLLRTWVAKDDAARILEWAARHLIGHRGFLELGGNELLGSAVRNAAPSRIGFGERLDQALGRTAAIDFLKAALRASTEALLAGRSVRTVRDQIEADLVRHLDRVDGTLLAAVLRQTGLALDLVVAIARHIAAVRAGRPADGKLLAARCAAIEQKADRIALESRKEVDRLDARPVIGQLIDRIEDAIDELEQAAFVASLLPEQTDPALLASLAELCVVAATAAETASRGVAAAIDVPEGRRIDSEDALAAVARLIDAEHAADTRERATTTLVFGGGFDVATSLSVIELARAIERATDRFAAFGHLLRRHIMIDLAA
jgi:uncharacterized protein Yka (UPF0111/DUF47 family)